MYTLDSLNQALNEYVYLVDILIRSLDEANYSEDFYFFAKPAGWDYQQEIITLVDRDEQLRRLSHIPYKKWRKIKFEYNLNKIKFVTYPLSFENHNRYVDPERKLSAALEDYLRFLKADQKIGNMNQAEFKNLIYDELLSIIYRIKPHTLVEVEGDVDSIYSWMNTGLFIFESEEYTLLLSFGFTD